MLWFPSKHGSEMEIAAGGGVPALAAHAPATVCKGWLAVKLQRSHLGIRQSFFFCCFSSEQTASCQHRAGREQRAQDGAKPSGEQRLPRARARLQAPRSAEQLRRKLASSSFSWSFNYFLYFSMKGERGGGGGGDLQRPGESGCIGSLPSTAEEKITESRKKPPKGLEELTFSCFKGSMGQMRGIFVPRQIGDRLRTHRSLGSARTGLLRAPVLGNPVSYTH